MWAIDRQVFQKIMMCTRLQMQKQHMDFLQRSDHILNRGRIISHITTSETEIKSFQPLKLFQSYFSDIERVGKSS